MTLMFRQAISFAVDTISYTSLKFTLYTRLSCISNEHASQFLFLSFPALNDFFEGGNVVVKGISTLSRNSNESPGFASDEGL